VRIQHRGSHTTTTAASDQRHRINICFAKRRKENACRPDQRPAELLFKDHVAPRAKPSSQMALLFLSVPDFCPHSSFLATNLATPLTRSLCSHSVCSNLKNSQWIVR
jgi:hypothetical protein